MLNTYVIGLDYLFMDERDLTSELGFAEKKTWVHTFLDLPVAAEMKSSYLTVEKIPKKEEAFNWCSIYE